MMRVVTFTAMLLASTSAFASERGGSAATAVAGAAAVSGAVSASGGGSASVNSERQAPGVSAPSLATSGETCMGSSSIGASGAGFGVAIDSTWNSDQCERRMNAQQLRLAGETKAALALICMNPGVADAMRAVGKSCPALPEKADAVMSTDGGFCARWANDPYCKR